MPPPTTRQDALHDIYTATTNIGVVAVTEYYLACRRTAPGKARSLHEVIALLSCLVEMVTTINGAAPGVEDILAEVSADILREAVRNSTLGLPMIAVRAAAARLLQARSAKPVWTEGVYGDGAVILRDGKPVPISDVLAFLNEASARTFPPERDSNAPLVFRSKFGPIG